MIEAACMDHLQPASSLPDPMDISDSATTVASPPSSDFPELLPFSAVSIGSMRQFASSLGATEHPTLANTSSSFAQSSSYHISADCSLLLSPVSSVASPPMPHVVRQYAIFPDNPLNHLPSPPNSGKMFYPHWNTTFGMGHGPGPNDDVAIPPEFYMQERCTPDPESFLSAYTLVDSQSQPPLNQPPPYFMPVPRLGSNGPPMMHNCKPRTAESPQTLETFSEVSTPGEGSKAETTPAKRASRKRSVSAASDAKKDEVDSDVQDDGDSQDEVYGSSQRSSSGGVRKSRKRAAVKRSSASRIPPVDAGEYQNCFGDLVAPQLKDNCPKEERCIFSSRWKHRNKKGQDMWDSIQEDYYKEFEKEQCKETLQMKLTRGRSKYLKWLEKDEELLRQAWQNMERNRYKLILEEFYKLGGSRNMLLNPSDVEVKVVVDMALEEDVYVEGVNEMEIRRRCRFLTGKKKTSGRNAEEPGISYKGPSLFGRAVDEDEVIDQVMGQQLDGDQRKGLAQRRKRSSVKPSRGPKKVKLEKE
ncbi:hypothetical protein ISF_05106 [Cordyceps fumosorosea ARSEF 2679]|uniref:Uncharacterized protein n=1 Tax=Cordyceps fumosorosea (strain ARSEF 2679) TaxID=1081104 RepID=A0A167V0K8_CORFA|nr:hypothetical protein ISF_05106 [Cordyceps fumosorosea ARSEF 2679]OAA62097.1 hypothetical protein ISF_05106 [Cordyceps fumosorosea ARSEF 2679]